MQIKKNANNSFSVMQVNFVWKRIYISKSQIPLWTNLSVLLALSLISELNMALFYICIRLMILTSWKFIL